MKRSRKAAVGPSAVKYLPNSSALMAVRGVFLMVLSMIQLRLEW